MGFFNDDLLHTSNGREYITRPRLEQEVATAIDAAGGRLPLVDLPSSLGVDLAHCERAASEVVSTSKGAISLTQGELLTTRYFDSLAEDLNEELQGSGVVAIGDLARRTGLGVEMLQGALRERLGKIVYGRLEGGVIYTENYLTRVKAQLRGALRGALAPLTLAALRKDLGIENLGGLGALVPSLAEELLKDGAIVGKLAAGGTWVPASYARSQQDFVRSFYRQNGYVSYDMATKYGMTNPTQHLRGEFPDGQALATVFASPAVAHQVEASVEEAVHSGTWCDVMHAVSTAFTSADAAQLLAKCPAAMEKNVRILAETCALSATYLEAIRTALCEDAKKAAQEAHAAKKRAATKAAPHSAKSAVAPSTAGKKGGSKSAPVLTADAGSDDDWDMGKGKGKKGGKAGGKKGGKGDGGGKGGSSAKLQQQSAKQGGGGGKGGKSASTPDVSSASTASILSLEALERRVIELHPDLEGAGADGDLPAAIVGEVRPAVVAEYERALSDIFTAGADRRKRLREAASSRLETCFQSLQLYTHGAELFVNDEATSIVLQRHIVHTAAPLCVDALVHLLSADVVDETEVDRVTPPSPEEAVSRAMTPSERTTAAREAPSEAQAPLEAVVKALGAAATVTSAADFINAMERASEAVGLRLKRLDRKSEGPLVQAQLTALKSQAEEAADAPTLLAAAVPLLVAKLKGRAVSLPGRALAAAVELLREELEEDQHAALAEFHAAVVDNLKAAGDGDALAEVRSKLESLEPKVRALIGV